MLLDLQKAMIWKRISAWLFDAIILGIVVVGAAFLLSTLLGYDQYSQTLNESYARYETQYGVTFDLTQEQYNQLTQAEQQAYDQAYQALTQDGKAMHAYSMMMNLTLLITTLSILMGYLILELLVPLLLGNGQTLGKKIFAIGVMRTNGVKINGVILFIRTILGKFTIETMIPVLVGLMIFFGNAGIYGTLLVGALLLAQIILLAATKTNSLIHDLLASTVVIDMGSQMIFESEEALLEYKKQAHAQRAAREAY